MNSGNQGNFRTVGGPITDQRFEDANTISPYLKPGDLLTKFDILYGLRRSDIQIDLLDYAALME